MAYHQVKSIVDQHLTQDMANFQLSRSLVSVGYYVNLETRSSIAHYHPYYEFILVRKGVCEYFCEGGRFSLHPDEMLLIPPGTVHAMSCPEGFSSYERLILQVDREFIRHVAERCRLCEGEEPPVPLYIFRVDAVCRWGLRELIERINTTSAVREAALREDLYRCQIGELLLTMKYIMQIAGPADCPESSATERLIAEITAHIREHFREPELSVGSIAQSFYVSREHLSRTFKSQMNESISHYITYLRMQEFRYGLSQGKNVQTACMESGFSNYSSFVKSFRKLYGITPAEYREQLNTAMRHDPKGQQSG